MNQIIVQHQQIKMKKKNPGRALIAIVDDQLLRAMHSILETPAANKDELCGSYV